MPFRTSAASLFVNHLLKSGHTGTFYINLDVLLHQIIFLMNKLQSSVGTTADILTILTFLFSVFSIKNAGNIIWIDAFGAPLSTFRFFITSLLIFSSTYAIGKLFSRFIVEKHRYDKQFRILVYGVTSSISAWITVFTYQSFLYGTALNNGFWYKVGFTILVCFAIFLTFYFMKLNIPSDKYDREEFEDTFVGILVTVYGVFWFVPAFSW